MNDLLSHLQALDPPAVNVVVLVLASLVLVLREPIAGKRAFARFLVEEASEGEPARLRHYRSWTLQGCTSAVLAVVLVLALPGVSLSDMGARGPSWPRGDSVASSAVTGMIAGMLLAVVGVAVALLVRRGRSRRTSGDAPATPASAETPAREPRGQMVAVLPMLPRTTAGRRGWAMLSLSAGVTEEITYRGLLLLTLAVVLPNGTPAVALVVATAVLFGLAHWYQGWTGVVSTGVFGALMAGLFLVTGSLLLPMALHTLVDLRALLLPLPAQSMTSGAERPAGSGSAGSPAESSSTATTRPDPS